MIGRRRLVALAVALGVPLSAPLGAGAQPAGRAPRVGFVTTVGRTVNAEAFEQGLRELGYTVGQNVTVEYRFGEGRLDRVPAMVEEVLRLQVDVLFAANPYVIRVARDTGTRVPIVGIDLETDPVEAGWVTSLARPGGNLTGFFLNVPELSGKQLELLTETVPRLQRVAVLWDAQIAASQYRATEEAARTVKVTLLSFPVRQAEEFAAAVDLARQQRAQALVLLSSPSMFVHLPRLAELSAQHRLPAISVFPQFADLGGLMGFGPNLPDLYRRAAAYVDRILKGARPGDLPIQRPVLFRLAVNLRTARALGLAVPPSILARADSVIE